MFLCFLLILKVWGAMVSSTYQLTKFKSFEESIAKLFWSTNTKNMSPDFVFFVRQIFVLDWLMTLVFSTYQLSFGKFLLPNFLRAFAVAKKSSNCVFFVGTRTPLVELVEIHHTEKKLAEINICGIAGNRGTHYSPHFRNKKCMICQKIKKVLSKVLKSYNLSVWNLL